MFSITIEVRNICPAPLTVWFEPWADHVVLENDAVIEVQCNADQPATMSVEYGKDTLLIFGLPGSTMRAMQNGKVIWECHQALPPLPT
jgi:hypothetical protein